MFDQLVGDLEKMYNLSPGSYSVILNDNSINKGSGNKTKENKSRTYKSMIDETLVE